MLFMRGWETALSIIIQKAGGNMNIQEIIDKKISKLSDEITMASDNIASNKINKADYDKTLIGFVSEKIVPENPKDDNDYKWRIQTNGVAYDIKPSACNITAVGQRVRLYVPNHSLKDKYAEVIDNISVVCTTLEINNDSIIFGYSDDTAQEVSITRDENQRITSFSIGERIIEVKWNVSG